MIKQILQTVRDQQTDSLQRLFDYLRIPSVSTDPAFTKDCQTAADWTGDRMRECGLDVTIHPTAGHPIVIGRYHGAGADKPTVLFYGHYDVQPPDPLELWHTPPFEPTVRDDRVYARGACDDKGQVMTFLEALRAWHTVAGKPPVNVVVMIEGEEECGSKNLDGFIEKHQDLLKADVAIVSDTSMWDADTPAITYALRGLQYFDIKLYGPKRDLHSGVYGGTVANPATELVLILGRLFDDQHRVTLPGFYDPVEPLQDSEREGWSALNFNDAAYGHAIGLDALHGEAGYSTLERRWARPSCDVNGLYGGYMGEGAKTVIPAFAGAKVSFRLAARQDPDQIVKIFQAWLENQTPPGCRWDITCFGGAHPVSVSTHSPWISAASRAIEAGCGRKPVLVREGATIPVVGTFKTVLGLDTLLIGFGLNDDNLHSPNEKFDLANYRKGCLTHAALLHELAGATA